MRIRFEYNCAHLLRVKPDKEFLESLRWDILAYTQYSRYVASSDYRLFCSIHSTNLQKQFSYFSGIENVSDDIFLSTVHLPLQNVTSLPNYL